MNRSELIDWVAEEADLSKKQAGQAVDAVLSAFVQSLRRNDPVVLPGFGSFSVSERGPRVGRHPQTGAPLAIAATRIPRFKASQTLKEAIQ